MESKVIDAKRDLLDDVFDEAPRNGIQYRVLFDNDFGSEASTTCTKTFIGFKITKEKFFLNSVLIFKNEIENLKLILFSQN